MLRFRCKWVKWDMKNECQLPVVDMTVEQRHVICGQAQRRHGLDQESELTTPVNAEHRGTASNIFKANVQSQSARVQFLLNSKQGKKMETLPKNAKQCVWKSHILHLASCNWGPDKPHCNGCFWMSPANPVGKLFAACIQQRKFQKIDLSLEAILTDISQVDNHWMPCTERSHRKRLFQQRHKEKKTWPIQFAVMHRKSFKCWTKQILQLQLVRPRFPFGASTIRVKTHRHKLKRIVPSDNWWEPTDS